MKVVELSVMNECELRAARRSAAEATADVENVLAKAAPVRPAAPADGP